ncbi:hypothetical protein IJJ36_02570 [Candidatus Saccharibacteria bacterium]|nr:hypothetical protein [Candidatus Saccharibacteria bacterium]
MKKKVLATVLSVILILALGIVTMAAIYISQQARMTLFSGHIEQTTNNPDDPKLILKVEGEDVGQDGNVSVYDTAVFPILTNVVGETAFNDATVWTDENGRTPIAAPVFVLSAENGDVNNVYFNITGLGDMTAGSAMRFGITTVYYSEEEGTEVTRSQIEEFVMGGPEKGESTTVMLGDGTIAEGEEVRIYVAAWVDSYALAEIGEYGDGNFTIDIVFSSDSAA